MSLAARPATPTFIETPTLPNHEIRLRGGWQHRDPALSAKITLPLEWSTPLSNESLHLLRFFQAPKIDRDREGVWLRVANAPGMLALNLNGESLVGGDRDRLAADILELPLTDLQPGRNELAVDLATEMAQSLSPWGCFSLWICPLAEGLGMLVDLPLEQRLSAVEAAVAELRRRLPASNPNWLQQVVGSQKDEPAFDDVLAYGRAYRVADRPSLDNGS